MESHILLSPFTRHPAVTDQNFGAFMVAKLEAHPKSRFVNGSSHASWSYAQVAGQARAVCRGLRRLGLGRGCTAYLLSNSRAELVPALFGAACANVAVAYEQPDYGVDVLVDMMEPLRPDAVLCEHSALNKVLQVQERLSCVKHVVLLGAGEAGDKALSWSQLLEPGDGADHWPPEYVAGLPCYLPQTSGTTGKPKAVVHTHDSLLASVQAAGHPDQLSLGEEDVLVCTSVLGHVYACFDCVCKGIVQGASTVFLEYKASIEALLEALQKHRATALCTVPFVAQQLLAYPHLDRYDLSSLRHLTTATSYISPDISKGLFEKLNLTSFAQLYGQSEIIFVSAGIYGQPPNFTSMGRLGAGIEGMIRDVNTGKALGPGERGELLLRGRGLMRGYWQRLDEPVTDADGWYRTGDLCYSDEDGWLYMVQRISEMIQFREHKVPPADVEYMLLRCPEVADCAVVGLPDPEATQLLHAVIVPKKPVGEEHFVNFMKENALSCLHLEGGVTLTDAIPRNKLGKLVRRQLVEWVLQRSKHERR
ncbi:4-coumarate--CoA ligase 3 [Ixodes scapularis]|uniref:4-coumarate--CoA ligase 3 n=1 Tax=Ixodes scapularis TaxID=6945 RepID=UPI001C3814F8|nr:4-coumarate--CoA ligase 3 [Ixodes scapularis]XP_042145952.1 4-coumarate--CoA ligase 3 [Ixodes scapularis]